MTLPYLPPEWPNKPESTALACLARKRAQVAVNVTTPAGIVAMTFDAPVDVIAPSKLGKGE